MQAELRENDTRSLPSPWHSARSPSWARIPKLNSEGGPTVLGSLHRTPPPNSIGPDPKNSFHLEQTGDILQSGHIAVFAITAVTKQTKLNHPKPSNNITTKHVIQGLQFQQRYFLMKSD